MTEPSAVLRFYRGGADAAGRTLDDILAWNDDRLEAVHDYIQWLFPLPERSAFNMRAPILTRADADMFDTALRDRLLAALDRMLRFYGFIRRAGLIVPAPDYRLRAANWLTPGNHNHLRLSRILRSLALLGCNEAATAFLAALEQAAEGAPRGAVSEVTRRYWRQAAASRW